MTQDGPKDPPTDAVVEHLTLALVRTLRHLGDAGEPAIANQIAAKTYAAVRHEQPLVAERLNQVMHRLARLEGPGQPSTRRTPMATDLILDVRSEPPVRRHTLIFETFEKLAPGTGFELVNDHDPKPLYYQLDAEQPGTFTWDYLESGPTVWRVRIGRVDSTQAASAS